MTAFTLVHSPLVGPRTWWAVRDELGGRGHEVAVPSLTDAAATGDHMAIVRAATRSIGPGPDRVLVGHSGAGYFLPLIADALESPPTTLVFVDSAVPPAAGPTPLLPADLLAQIAPLAVEGVLPPWSEWFGAEAMRTLVPDAATRAALVEEMPRLPLAYFEPPLTMPSGWHAIDCRYLLLSAAYTDDAREATRLGWPSREHASHHLAIVTDARGVTDALLALAWSK